MAPCFYEVKKGKAVPQHTHGGARGERMYSSYSFTTWAQDGGEWSASRPGRALPPGPTVQVRSRVAPRAGLDSEVREKILYLRRGSNLDRTVVQSVARHYTDWAISARFYEATRRDIPEGCHLQPVLRSCRRICLERRRKTTTIVRIASFPTKIQILNLRNTYMSVNRYSSTSVV
jgi:hypothetical protein